jgi:hypothetical protein
MILYAVWWTVWVDGVAMLRALRYDVREAWWHR